MPPTVTTWAGRSVLVTGADGFLGSHLCEALLSLGANVTAVVRRVSGTQVTSRMRNLTPVVVDALHRLVHVDLAGPSAVETLSRIETEVWFHLAADAYVPASLQQPASVVQTNLGATLNVLEAARMGDPEHVLVTSSSEVYGSHAEMISEHHPLMPATPYAASKAAADRLAWSYFNTYGVPVTIVRPFNSYGPRHIYDAVPLFLAKALRGDPILINGTGEQTRDLTYVADTVAGFVALAGLPGEGEVYNIGTGTDHRVIDTARMVVELTGTRSEIVHGPPRRGDVTTLRANPEKIMRTTGWTPKYDLAAGLAANLDWLRENVDAIWPTRS